MDLNGKQMTVKNRAPAPVQITAEQILREARERQDDAFEPPKSQITDPEEMAVYRMGKRKEYEDSIRRQRQHIGTWTKYAKWEESQHEIERARSIYERALDVEYTNKTIWLRYAEMEMRNKYPNRARNVWDRAVTLLPRVDQFWYKYAFMEEMLQNIAGARVIFERWMKWEPEEHAWMSYVYGHDTNTWASRRHAHQDMHGHVHSVVGLIMVSWCVESTRQHMGRTSAISRTRTH